VSVSALLLTFAGGRGGPRKVLALRVRSARVRESRALFLTQAASRGPALGSPHVACQQHSDYYLSTRISAPATLVSILDRIYLCEVVGPENRNKLRTRNIPLKHVTSRLNAAHTRVTIV